MSSPRLHNTGINTGHTRLGPRKNTLSTVNECTKSRCEESTLQQAFESLQIQRSGDASDGDASFVIKTASSQETETTWVSSSYSDDFDLEHGAGAESRCFIASEASMKSPYHATKYKSTDKKRTEVELCSPIAGGISRWHHVGGKRMRVSSTPQSIKFDKVTPPPKYRSPSSDTKSLLIDLHRKSDETEMSPGKVIKELFEPRSAIKRGRVIVLACATGFLLVQAALYVAAMNRGEENNNPVRRALTAIKVHYNPGVKMVRQDGETSSDADFYGSMLASLEEMDRTRSATLVRLLDGGKNVAPRDEDNTKLENGKTASGVQAANKAHKELPVLQANSDLLPVFLPAEKKWKLSWKGNKLP